MGQLKAALKEWGLPVSGNKATLWQRLLDQASCWGLSWHPCLMRCAGVARNSWMNQFMCSQRVGA